MNGVKKTVLEVVILGLISVAVAFTANTVRARGSIGVWRNYFDTGVQRVPIDRPQEPGPPSEKDDEVLPGDNESDPADRHPAYPYKEITFEEAVAIFDDPNTATGLNVFIDARDDDAYESGHIPGAIQADHYRLEEYIDRLLDFVQAAEKVVVYCNGGDCEDSMFLCSDLLDFDVSCDKIHLYPGGWEEWAARNMPVAKGREGEEHLEP